MKKSIIITLLWVSFTFTALYTLIYVAFFLAQEQIISLFYSSHQPESHFFMPLITLAAHFLQLAIHFVVALVVQRQLNAGKKGIGTEIFAIVYGGVLCRLLSTLASRFQLSLLGYLQAADSIITYAYINSILSYVSVLSAAASALLLVGCTASICFKRGAQTQPLVQGQYPVQQQTFQPSAQEQYPVHQQTFQPSAQEQYPVHQQTFQPSAQGQYPAPQHPPQP